MCGRIRQSKSSSELITEISKWTSTTSFATKVKWIDEESERKHKARENIPPGYRMSVLRSSKSSSNDECGELELVSMIWGLVPSYTKGRIQVNHWKMFNARSESALSKSTFSRLVTKRRCAIPIQGFYEWKKLLNGKKQPYYLTLKQSDESKSLIFAAGLYDLWIDKTTEEKMYSFTILTMDACSSIFNWLHDRQPVLLDNISILSKWLDCKNTSAEIAMKDARMLGGKIDLQFHAVTYKMTNHKYQGKDSSKDVHKSASSIKNWFKKSTTKKMNNDNNNMSMKKIKGNVTIRSFTKKCSSSRSDRNEEGFVIKKEADEKDTTTRIKKKRKINCAE